MSDDRRETGAPPDPDALVDPLFREPQPHRPVAGSASFSALLDAYARCEREDARRSASALPKLPTLAAARARVEGAYRDEVERAEKAEAQRDHAVAHAVKLEESPLRFANIRLTAERDEARSERDAERGAHLLMSDRCEKAEAERDRLAAALRALLVFHAADDETLLSLAAPDYRAAVLGARAALPGHADDAATSGDHPNSSNEEG